MPVIQFPGKYVYRPGAVKGIDLLFQNNTGRKINDLLLYVFPVSPLVDTPDITKARITSGGKKIIDVDNADKDGDAKEDLDEIKIERIDPPIGENASFEIVMDFEDEFAGDEGVAIIATWDGRAIGSTDPGTAAEEIPEGPSVFDLVIELAKMVPIGTLLGRVEKEERDASSVMVASAAIGEKRLSQRALLEIASFVRTDAVAHGMVLNAAKTRQPKTRRRLTLSSRPQRPAG
jgi:hypothetical protein